MQTSTRQGRSGGKAHLPGFVCCTVRPAQERTAEALSSGAAASDATETQASTLQRADAPAAGPAHQQQLASGDERW